MFDLEGYISSDFKKRKLYQETGEFKEFTEAEIKAACVDFDSKSLEAKMECLETILDYENGKYAILGLTEWLQDSKTAINLVKIFKKANVVCNRLRDEDGFKQIVSEWDIDVIVELAISMLIADLTGNLEFAYEQSLKGDKGVYSDFWQIVQIASKLIHQEQSFEVSGKVKGVWSAKIRDEQIDKLLE